MPGYSINSTRNGVNRNIFVIVVAVLVGVGVILALGVALGLRGVGPSTTDLPLRIDCYPESRWGTGGDAVGRLDCERRGCEYDGDERTIDAGAPSCFVSPASVLGSGYLVKTVSESQDGLEATLLTNAPAESDVTFRPLNAKLEVQYAGENVLRIKVYALYTLYRQVRPKAHPATQKCVTEIPWRQK